MFFRRFRIINECIFDVSDLRRIGFRFRAFFLSTLRQTTTLEPAKRFTLDSSSRMSGDQVCADTDAGAEQVLIQRLYIQIHLGRQILSSIPETPKSNIKNILFAI
jgi:hypothetical protein